MIVLAAVYEPDDRLLTFIADLRQAAPGADVVVVDDGSGQSFQRRLSEVPCTVLRHNTNRGKGVALKTGFRHIAEAYPGRDVICADPDGQHRIADVLRVADRVRLTRHIVLGVRRFEGRVPLRSRVGNTMTRLLFRGLTGRSVADTQTGLRGYPSGLLEWLSTVPGERFEYEMNVLLYALRAGHPIEQTEIATAYVEHNASSHFGSLSDSARVYRALLLHGLSAGR